MPSVTPTPPSRRSLPVRVATGWFLGFTALTLATWAGGQSAAAFGSSVLARSAVQGAIMSGIVAPGIWWLAVRRDRLSPHSLGLGGLRQSLGGAALGVGIVFFPAVTAAVFANSLGWGTVSLNASAAALRALAASVVGIFFFEAFPEDFSSGATFIGVSTESRHDGARHS